MTEVRPARDADEVRAAFALRHEVFVVEQGVPLEEEIDEHDETDALHLVAVAEDGRVVATCRLVAEGDTVKLGRVALAASAPRPGIASRLLPGGEARAPAPGPRPPPPPPPTPPPAPPQRRGAPPPR